MVIVLPSITIALETLDDVELAEITGQDGVSINLTPSDPINFNLYIEDTDGLGERVDDNGFVIKNVKQQLYDFAAADELVKAGLVTVRGIELDTGPTGINLEIDAGSALGAGLNTGVLQIGVEIPYLVINEHDTFKIGVAGIEVANDDEVRNAENGWQRVSASLSGDVTDVISIGGIKIENYKLAFQLAPEADHFIAVADDAQPFSYEAQDYAFSDASGLGKLTVDTIEIHNIDFAGAKALITDNGIRINFADGRSKSDIMLGGVGFGHGTTFGDLEINGLDFGGASLTIGGK